MITYWSKSFKNKFHLVLWLLSKAKKLQIGLFLESSFSQSNTFKDGQTCQRKTICTQHQHTDITSKIFKRYTWVTSMSTCTMLQDVQMLLRAEHLCSTSKVLSYLHVSLLTMLVILTNCLTNSLVHRQPPPKFFHSMWQMDSRGQVNPENLVKHLSIESHTGLYIYQIRLQNWILCCCAKVSK